MAEWLWALGWGSFAAAVVGVVIFILNAVVNHG
jgi:hypothetical protein